MKNLTAKHNYNKAQTHRDRKNDYDRTENNTISDEYFDDLTEEETNEHDVQKTDEK